jgi:hypothetical protein
VSRYVRKAAHLEPPLGVVRVEVAPKVALVFTAPIHIIPETNQREHWGAKARRVKKHRSAAMLITRAALGTLRRRFPLVRDDALSPAVVTLTRIIGYRGRPLDQGDNLPAAFKAIRDGIADALQVNDGDETRVWWEYAPEERGTDWAIRIRIKKREP